MAKLSEQIVAKKLAELKTPERIVEFARGMGLSDEQIIRNSTSNKSAAEVAAFARKYAKALGLSYAEIRKIAGPRS